MTRHNSGQISGQTRDTRDIDLAPTRDTRDKPPRRAVPCPGEDAVIPGLHRRIHWIGPVLPGGQGDVHRELSRKTNRGKRLILWKHLGSCQIRDPICTVLFPSRRLQTVNGSRYQVSSLIYSMIFDCITVRSATDESLLERHEPSSDILRQRIYADRDEGDLHAPRSLMERLQGRLRVETYIPPAPAKDKSDVLITRKSAQAEKVPLMNNDEYALEQIKEAIAQLVEEGLVVDSGRHRLGLDGKLHIVWVAAEKPRCYDA
jgi:hypothetical protein